MKIMKFGGSSMGSAQMINTVKNIVVHEFKNQEVIVVVSAMGGITDMLISLNSWIKAGNVIQTKSILQEIYKKHIDALSSLNPDVKCLDGFDKLFNQLKNIVNNSTNTQILDNKTKAHILYFGEVLSSYLLVCAIQASNIKSCQILSKDLIATDEHYLTANVDFWKTESQTKKKFKSISKNTIAVVTGFAGGDEQGNPALLDRGGSDYVATILGEAMDADSVEIRTDVDGVFSADPRLVPGPVLWDCLDYEVSAEMALAGARVLHPKTMFPAYRKNIPVYVKNTFNPKAKGTKIHADSSKGIKGINLCRNQVLCCFSHKKISSQEQLVKDITKIFEDNNISIQSCAIQNNTLTCSIKKEEITDDIVKKLNTVGCELHLIQDMARISIIGKNLKQHTDMINIALAKMDADIVHITTKSKSLDNITLFINDTKSPELLKVLHEKLFNHNIVSNE